MAMSISPSMSSKGRMEGRKDGPSRFSYRSEPLQFIRHDDAII